MTAQEIKKAFNTFKKELAKETGHSGGFTMSGRQIELRTATYLVCNILPYDTEIERCRKTVEKVLGYDTWSDEAKERTKQEYAGYIAGYEARKAKYGTKENELLMTLKEVENSGAFKKFASNFEQVTLTTETGSDGFCYYIRFHY